MISALVIGMISAASVAQAPPRIGPPPSPPIHVVPGQPPRYLPPGHGHGHHRGGAPILGPGPGDGWGFPNGAPDGYGWYSAGYNLPLGADRTPEYYFPRYFAVPAQTAFFPTYYNEYTTRGQRYIPYAGCGGAHPMGGPPLGPANLPVTPYEDASRRGPVVEVPAFTGEVQAQPIAPGESDLMP